LTQQLIDAAIAVLVPLITALLVKLFQKAKLDVSGQRQARIEYFVRQAILEAEEWAAKRLQAKLDTEPTQKLDRAVRAITKQVPTVTVSQAIDLVHAELPKSGLGASAAVPTSAVAVVPAPVTAAQP
jgi:hypothetical protein